MSYIIKVGNNKGMVLILTFIVMTVLTAIAASLLYMTSIQTKGSGYDIASSKAIWLAEAGIQKALYSLRNDASYRLNPTAINGSLGSGAYAVSVSKESCAYSITSTGTVGVLSREITQGAIVAGFSDEAFKYAVFGKTNNNTLELEDEVTISGNLYYDGDVEVDDDASVINGFVYADSVSGDGTYTEAPAPPDPVPSYPALNTSWYDSQISTADSRASSDWTLSGSSSYNLNGGTVYYKKVTIKDNAAITGTGTIVATKEVVIQNNANISSSVNIVTKKTLNVKNSAIIQSEAILYARDNITIEGSANITGSILSPVSGKWVMMKGTAALTGIIYADEVELRENSVVNGSVVTEDFHENRMEDDARVTFSQLSIPVNTPPGFSASVSVTPQKDWNEVAPA